jgi:hypothetical protein
MCKSQTSHFEATTPRARVIGDVVTGAVLRTAMWPLWLALVPGLGAPEI